jgi:5-methylcytosine-specific restriction endonuclease McrA
MISVERQMVSRSKDKYDFQKKFRPYIFWNKFKRHYFGLFDDKCFNCKRQCIWRMVDECNEYNGGEWVQDQLVIDHHYPFERGGRLASGNLVSLCKACNSQKGALCPEDFYAKSDLERLHPYLVAQDLIIPRGYYWTYDQYTNFMRSGWREKLEALLAEGINEELARSALKNEFHRYHCP